MSPTTPENLVNIGAIDFLLDQKTMLSGWQIKAL